MTSTLSWSEHISRSRSKCAQRKGMIRKIRHLLPNHVLRRIYVAQVRSVMEYGCAVWSGDNISMLQKLQDRFCRGNHVKLPPVQARLNYLTLLLFYKILCTRQNGHRDKFRCYRRFHDQGRSSDNFENWVHFHSHL